MNRYVNKVLTFRYGWGIISLIVYVLLTVVAFVLNFMASLMETAQSIRFIAYVLSNTYGYFTETLGQLYPHLYKSLTLNTVSYVLGGCVWFFLTTYIHHTKVEQKEEPKTKLASTGVKMLILGFLMLIVTFVIEIRSVNESMGMGFIFNSVDSFFLPYLYASLYIPLIIVGLIMTETKV